MQMISAISARGKMRFMTHGGRMNTKVFCEFLKRLMHRATHKIFLIVDGHPVHRSALAKRFVESTKGMLRLFYLPPYSPELNPDELVWNNVKGKIGRSSIKGTDDLKVKVLGALKSLQQNPNKICAFFHEPNVRYAAA